MNLMVIFLFLTTQFSTQFWTRSMSNQKIPKTSSFSLSLSSVDCDSNFITTSSSSSSALLLTNIMPSLIHNTKRKRLDAVLTKLSMTKSADETVIESSPSSSNEHFGNLVSNVSKKSSDFIKSPKKQLSLDSEMSMNVGNLNINIGVEYPVEHTKSNHIDSQQQQQECISSTTLSSMFSPTTTYEPSTTTTAVASASVTSSTVRTSTATTAAPYHEYSNTNSKEIDSLLFNTSSDLLASSMPMSALFTPPTSDSAGGTVEFEDEEGEEEIQEVVDEEDGDDDVVDDDVRSGGNGDVDEGTKNDDQDEINDTRMTTVTMANAKCMQFDSDNLFGSHDFSRTTTNNSNSNKERLLLKRLPQAKLLSHDFASSSSLVPLQLKKEICQNAVQVPDTQTRTTATKTTTKTNSKSMAQTLIPVCVSESVSSSTSSVNNTFKLPLFDTLPSSSVPIICKCFHCQTLAPQNQTLANISRMLSISRHHQSPSQHSWSWHNLKSDAFSSSSSDSFFSLISSATGSAGEITKSPNNVETKCKKPLLNCIEELKKEKCTIVDDQSKKRSYSDSDVLVNYFNVFKHLHSGYNAGTHYLPQAESGLIVKNGRSVPKPLHKTSLVQSEHSTPQDSPLDLSLKSLNAQFIATESDYPKYSSLLAQANATFTNSCSVPSLTSIVSPKYFQFCSRNRQAQSFKIPNDESPHKRRNASSSETIHSSSVSPMSPLEKIEQPKNPFIRDEDHIADGLKLSKSDDSVSVCNNQEKSFQINAINEKNQSISISSLIDIERKSFTCTICSQTFTLHDRLAKHIASRHKNRQQCDSVVKNYLCEICQRSFARSDMLTRHMRLHTGIKPYTCKICDQVFSRSDHLSTHQRTHTGEKPYKCPQCPYAACRRDMITRHMRTHSRYETPDSSSSTEELSK